MLLYLSLFFFSLQQLSSSCSKQEQNTNTIHQAHLLYQFQVISISLRNPSIVLYTTSHKNMVTSSLYDLSLNQWSLYHPHLQLKNALPRTTSFQPIVLISQPPSTLPRTTPPWQQLLMETIGATFAALVPQKSSQQIVSTCFQASEEIKSSTCYASCHEYYTDQIIKGLIMVCVGHFSLLLLLLLLIYLFILLEIDAN